MFTLYALGLAADIMMVNCLSFLDAIMMLLVNDLRQPTDCLKKQHCW